MSELTLADFLRARLDDEEIRAMDAINQFVEDDEAWWWFDNATPETPREYHIAAWSPKRVLYEVDARRQIIDEIDEVRGYEDQIDGEWGVGDWATDDPGRASVRILRSLAFPYADHPDYDEAWRPATSAPPVPRETP